MPDVASNQQESSQPPQDDATTESDSAKLVLVADSNDERGKQTSEAIKSWGLMPILVHDGVEAILAIQRRMPRVVILDAALPKMFGFQICEIVKRNESLRHIQVVLVGAIHLQDRYRREPSDLYGADVYLEDPDLPDGLVPLLRDAGLSLSVPLIQDRAEAPVPAPAAPQSEIVEPSPPLGDSFSDEPLEFDFPEPSSPEVAPVTTQIEKPEVPAAADEDPERTVERERAERLARIAVSEMLLYQPEKFDQAIRDGNVEAVLDLEIQEARALIRQRISDEVRAEKDFILVELARVAQERSAVS